MWHRFTPQSKAVVFKAQEFTVRIGAWHIPPPHLLMGVLEVTKDEQDRIFEKLGLKIEEIADEVEKAAIAKNDGAAAPLTLTDESKRAIDLSIEEMKRLGQETLTPSHLLLGLLRASPEAREPFQSRGIDVATVRKALSDLLDECNT